MNLTLHMAANGHLALDFNELSEAAWLSIAEELTSLQGLKRVGSPVTAVSEPIHHDFQCAELALRRVGTIGLGITCFQTLWQAMYF